jgi:hypothetical protein
MWGSVKETGIMKSQILLTISLISTACQVHATSFKLTGFDSEEISAIQNASEEWSSYGYPVVLNQNGDGEILKLPIACNHTDASGCHLFGATGEFIVIADNSLVRDFNSNWSNHVRKTILHELGHSLGLQDTSISNTIMCFSDTCRSEHITIIDLP